MTQRPLLLDLFCGAGGAAVGYHRAGFDLVGVDITYQKNYPFAFIQADALEFLATADLARFTAVHASPPCQRYSIISKAHNGCANEHPDLIAKTRRLLIRAGRPYVIENVPGAPMIDPVVLCGTMFPGLRVLRHRLFECSFPTLAPLHGEHPLCYTRDKRKKHYGKLDEMTAFVQVTGGGNCSVESARDAMGIDWMTKKELNEAIPPAYTQFIGGLLMEHLRAIRPAPGTSPTHRCPT